MNNTFSFERFVKVLKYDLKFRVPAIGISFLILLLLPHVFKFIMDFGGTFHQNIRKEVIEILCVIFIMYAPFKIYSSIREKQGRSAFMMLPASTLEKFASMVLVSLVMVPALFLTGSFIVDSLFAVAYRDVYIGMITFPFAGSFAGFIKPAIMIFALVGSALSGNAFFRKKAFAKTILCILCMLFLWASVVLEYISDHLVKIAWGGTDGTAAQLAEMGFTSEQLYTVSGIVFTLVGILFYVFAYWRMKKMQLS